MATMTSVLGSEHSNAANMVSVQVQTDYVKGRWENLKCTAETHKGKQLKREMAVLREELLGLAATVDALETTVTSREELEAKITKIQNELNLMKKSKNRLLQANFSVHRYLESTKHSDATLRDEVNELYLLWDQVIYKVSSQLFNLQNLSQAWHDFEEHLARLELALKTDTDKVLDFALECGHAARDAPVSLKDIADILYDKESVSEDSPADVSQQCKAASPALIALSTEGSLSDSGISDSGSEQELSEREKRLSQLKRLAKRLETILAPGSQALSTMFKRIEEAESDLRKLQKKCRDLIVRSASTEEIRMIVANAPNLVNFDLEGSCLASAALNTGKKGEENLIFGEAPKDSVGEGGLDCEGEKPGKKFWLWRLLRYAFPFQLALVALLCIASLLEPKCCDSLNNLEFSLNPQLRYDSGPPPV